MAEDSDDSERTEDATDYRREEFRRRGQVAQTRELASVLVLFGSMFGIWFFSRYFLQHSYELFHTSFTSLLLESARNNGIFGALAFIGKELFFMLFPVTLALFFFASAASVVQIGILNVEDALEIDWSRIDPLSGFKRMISMRAIVEGLKSVLKFSIIGVIVYVILKDQVHLLPRMASSSIAEIMSYIGMIAAKLFGALGVFMTILAASDYFFQRWDLEKKMRMTKQEVREEHKTREGDPLIKSRIRRLQREMAQKRMMEQVPKADVIITNPTHIAVALQYDGKSMVAPKLLAKGADLIAEKIRNLAKQHNIPIIENKPLARTIYKTLKIGQTIPRELYKAVAEVLSYVYKMKGKIKA